MEVRDVESLLRSALETEGSNRRAMGMKAQQYEELLRILKARFERNMNRHRGIEWPKVQARLEASAEKWWPLNEMERTGGEPDVVGHDKKTGEYVFYDCSAESPKGRGFRCLPTMTHPRA